jgi:hypothetical protein
MTSRASNLAFLVIAFLCPRSLALYTRRSSTLRVALGSVANDTLRLKRTQVCVPSPIDELARTIFIAQSLPGSLASTTMQS